MDLQARMGILIAVGWVLVLVAPAGSGGPPVPVAPFDVELEPVATGLAGPVYMDAPPDGSGRLFVGELRGRIKVLEPGAAGPAAWLDIASRVQTRGEAGLHSFAFHPGFAENGVLVVSYSNRTGHSILERFVVEDPEGGAADPGSGQVIFALEQRYHDHNGDHVAFGPDGYLYFSLGDGGNVGDPHGHAQNLSTLYGSVLRIDVGVTGPYRVPEDNPFVGVEGARGEIWSHGLRNPWRFSFDRLTGDLWIGDVGQDLWEEVNRQPGASAGGENYGWNWWEGYHPYRPGGPVLGVTWPVLEYKHGPGCSVTGGYVYRGEAIPSLSGAYLYGDFCSGQVWAAIPAGPVAVPLQILDTDALVVSFGQDEAGEVYVVDIRGGVYRIVPG